jgi:microcystin-dependent protein
MIRKTMLGLAAIAAWAAIPAQAQNFTGQIVMSGFGYCPPDTRLANGDLLPIQKAAPPKGEADYRDLYLLYGNAYGGDGSTTFALPDMRPQLIAMNNIGRGRIAPAKTGDGVPPAMRVELPIVFCVVIHGSKPVK